MEALDEHDLSLFLAYQHVTSLGMKQMGNQIYKLGVSAGIDLKSVACNLHVEEVVEVYRNSQKKSVTQIDELQTKNLVYSYLRRNNYHDVAEGFAVYCNLNQNVVNLSTDLETIFQSKGVHLIPQTDGKKKRRTWTRKGLTAGIDFCDTDSVKFSNANSNGGGIIMTYKGMQYSFQRYFKVKDVSCWTCRRKFKSKCRGQVFFSSKRSCVIKEVTHNDKDHTDRLIPSTMGTNDTSIRYSKTKRKTPVMHYCGYEYTIHRRSVDGKIRWQCREHMKKKCKGWVYTKNGHIDGQVREHNHLPPDLPPVDKPEGDRMISSLF